MRYHAIRVESKKPHPRHHNISKQTSMATVQEIELCMTSLPIDGDHRQLAPRVTTLVSLARSLFLLLLFAVTLLLPSLFDCICCVESVSYDHDDVAYNNTLWYSHIIV